MAYALYSLVIVLSTTSLLAGQVDDFDKADKWALAATEKDEASIAALSKYLVKGVQSDKEKARAIYRWMTDRIAYDADGFFSGKLGDQSSVGVFNRKIGVCAGYSNLFVSLASASGLKALRINGFAKGAGIKLGDKTSVPNHSWNAIQIDKKWYLIDSTWGAGDLSERKFQKKFKASYFLAEPERLIFTHFPTDSRWQLLEKAVTRKQFEEWPLIQPALLTLGASAKDIREVIDQKGEFVKAFQYPGNSTSIIQSPLQKGMKVNEEYRFKIKSDDFDEIIFMQKTLKLDSLVKDGAIFTGTITPSEEGVMRIAARKSDDKKYCILLEYTVK